MRVLHVSEVENLYYLSDVLAAVAERQASTLGEDPTAMVESVKSQVLSELGQAGTLDRLAKKLAKDAVSRELLAHMPIDIDTNDVSVTFPSPLAGILAELQRLHSSADYDGLVRALPLRDTGARTKVAVKLGFRHLRDYEKAARVCIGASVELVADLGQAIAPTAQ